MQKIQVTPVNGARVRKEDGSLLAAEGEIQERTTYWLRREVDGDVTIKIVNEKPAKK